MTQGIRAFKIKVIGREVIIFAKSRSSARYAAFKAANEAGFNIKFSDIESAERAKGIGQYAHTVKENWCYGLDYFERMADI